MYKLTGNLRHQASHADLQVAFRQGIRDGQGRHREHPATQAATLNSARTVTLLPSDPPRRLPDADPLPHTMDDLALGGVRRTGPL